MSQGSVLIREGSQYTVYAIYRTHALHEEFIAVYATAELASIRSYLRNHPEVDYNREELPELAKEEERSSLAIEVAASPR